MYLNKVTLMGFLGSDAVVRTGKNNQQFTTLSLATKSSYKDKETGKYNERTEWHRHRLRQARRVRRQAQEGRSYPGRRRDSSRKYDSNKRREADHRDPGELRSSSSTAQRRPPRRKSR